MEVQGLSSSSAERVAPLPRRRSRDGSHARGITKLAKPKIKIVHLFEPEIMMTDAANFRDLVQRFTGKPPPPPTPAYEDEAVAGRAMEEEEEKKKKNKKLPRMIKAESGGSEGSSPPSSELEIMEEVMRRDFEQERMMAMDNDFCGGGGGFLAEFEGIDFFAEELGDSINWMLPL